jgi:uracil-DNA glycosylase
LDFGKLIIVGQAPGRRGDPRQTLKGKVGRRLARTFGVSEEQYTLCTELHNVLECWPGKHGKGDRFPMAAAREAARNLKPTLEGNRVLLLGRAVAAAFGVRVGYLTWIHLGACLVAVLPHPSGINRWWNEPKNRRAAERFLRGLVGSEGSLGPHGAGGLDGSAARFQAECGSKGKRLARVSFRS